MAEAKSNRTGGYGVITLGVLAALMVATGRPEPDTLATVTGWGVPDGVATAALYVVPVVLIVCALLVGRALGRGRSVTFRWTVYALLGAVAGFVLGLCLEVFAGAPALVASLTGPLGEPTVLDVFLWCLTAFCLFSGVMVGLIGAFGRSAVVAIQVEDADAEFVEPMRSERGMFAWSAVGMVTLAIACAGLAIARQADEAARFAPIAIAIVAAIASIATNYAMWRGFDEMQRRHVVEGYAASAIVVTLGSFAWALAEAAGLVTELDATGVFLALIFVQLVAVTFVTSRAMGETAMLGKPA
jgi:hypothetical protein